MAGRGYQYERHTTGNADLERIQDNMQRTVEQINRRVVIEGVVMPGAGNVEVKHPLGRVPAGWRVLRAQGGAPQFYEAARTATTITFTSANACTVDLELE